MSCKRQASDRWLTLQIALIATNALLSSQLIVGIISSMHPVRPHLLSLSSADYPVLRSTTLAAVSDLYRLHPRRFHSEWLWK